jgi:uncharacterized membrane-anchored protein
MSELWEAERSPDIARSITSKVPQVTIAFWVVKILTTGMGEAASDFLVKKAGAVAVLLAALIFAATVTVQVRAIRYSPWKYWLTIVMISIFGTMAADIPHFLGVPLAVTSSTYLIALMLVFWFWYKRERTLSFQSIDSRARELFYWAAVVATFALGTALGDLTAHIANMGFLVAGLVFSALILIPLGARRWAGLSAVAAFWSAYVVTRPLGASFADWMAVPARHAGLGLGTGTVTVLWTAAIVATLALMGLRARRARPRCND